MHAVVQEDQGENKDLNLLYSVTDKKKSVPSDIFLTDFNNFHFPTSNNPRTRMNKRWRETKDDSREQRKR